MRPLAALVGSVAMAAAVVAALRSADRRVDDWPVYGHDPSSMRYSPLTDITRGNVTRLDVAWTFRTEDTSDGRTRPRSGLETTPIVVDGTLYLTTASNRVIALDPETGRQRWVDVETGRELWSGKLPSGGHATPMTYKLTARGKQYVVIAAGGHPKIDEEPIGDTLVAFAVK